jgi:RimJ/RimL family protein N-acetyltransferase
MPPSEPAPRTAPELVTERLILHGHGLKDFSDSAAMWADPDVVRFIGGRAFTEEEVWTRLLRYVGHWATLGYGFWAIREKAGGRFVGEVGFADFRRDLDPPFGDAPEMGWALMPWAHGKGYASEAIAAALAWGEGRFGQGVRTVCMISPENAPSIRAAEKAGYREFARTTYKGAPTVLFERV